MAKTKLQKVLSSKEVQGLTAAVLTAGAVVATNGDANAQQMVDAPPRPHGNRTIMVDAPKTRRVNRTIMIDPHHKRARYAALYRSLERFYRYIPSTVIVIQPSVVLNQKATEVQQTTQQQPAQETLPSSTWNMTITEAGTTKSLRSATENDSRDEVSFNNDGKITKIYGEDVAEARLAQIKQTGRSVWVFATVSNKVYTADAHWVNDKGQAASDIRLDKISGYEDTNQKEQPGMEAPQPEKSKPVEIELKLNSEGKIEEEQGSNQALISLMDSLKPLQECNANIQGVGLAKVKKMDNFCVVKGAQDDQHWFAYVKHKDEILVFQNAIGQGTLNAMMQPNAFSACEKALQEVQPGSDIPVVSSDGITGFVRQEEGKIIYDTGEKERIFERTPNGIQCTDGEYRIESKPAKQHKNAPHNPGEQIPWWQKKMGKTK